MYNPLGPIVCAEQSMDCLDPYFAHGTIHGLHAQSTDYCTICESIDCAGQSTDCPNPYFAHNICYAQIMLRPRTRPFTAINPSQLCFNYY